MKQIIWCMISLGLIFLSFLLGLGLAKLFILFYSNEQWFPPTIVLADELNLILCIVLFFTSIAIIVNWIRHQIVSDSKLIKFLKKIERDDNE